MQSFGMLRHVALVRTHISEERIGSIIVVRIIGELGKMLAATSNRGTPCGLLVTATVISSSPSLATVMMEATLSSGTSVVTRTTRCHIPEIDILYSHRRENL
jgi:hypothetical protein